jgi:WD40 repeat protein
MVIVKEKKSNLDCQWNRFGDKFVIGSSSGFVYQCTYNEAQKFWVAEQDRKARHTDSVIQVRYDPGSGHVVASVSLDGTVQIKSCYNADIDSTHDASGLFAGIRTSGVTVFKFNPGQWINSFSFSPSGEQFVWASKYYLCANATFFINLSSRFGTTLLRHRCGSG